MQGAAVGVAVALCEHTYGAAVVERQCTVGFDALAAAATALAEEGAAADGDVAFCGESGAGFRVAVVAVVGAAAAGEERLLAARDGDVAVGVHALGGCVAHAHLQGAAIEQGAACRLHAVAAVGIAAGGCDAHEAALLHVVASGLIHLDAVAVGGDICLAARDHYAVVGVDAVLALADQVERGAAVDPDVVVRCHRVHRGAADVECAAAADEQLPFAEDAAFLLLLVAREGARVGERVAALHLQVAALRGLYVDGSAAGFRQRQVLQDEAELLVVLAVHHLERAVGAGAREYVGHALRLARHRYVGAVDVDGYLADVARGRGAAVGVGDGDAAPLGEVLGVVLVVGIALVGRCRLGGTAVGGSVAVVEGHAEGEHVAREGGRETAGEVPGVAVPVARVGGRVAVAAAAGGVKEIEGVIFG